MAGSTRPFVYPVSFFRSCVSARRCPHKINTSWHTIRRRVFTPQSIYKMCLSFLAVFRSPESTILYLALFTTPWKVVRYEGQ